MTIVLDTETTGLRAGEDELLQVSIIDDSGEVLINHYVRPEAEAWPEAEAINHITPEDVRNCPRIYDPAVHKRIQRVLDDADLIIGYNTSFDIGFLLAANFEIPAVPQIDVMVRFAEIYGEWSDAYGDYKYQKLTTAANYYGFDWTNCRAHDSLSDCFATLYVYQQMQKYKLLRACPFCGGTAGYAASVIRCTSCGLDVVASYDHMSCDELIKSYNRRAGDKPHGAAETLAEIDAALPDPDGLTPISSVIGDLMTDLPF